MVWLSLTNYIYIVIAQIRISSFQMLTMPLGSIWQSTSQLLKVFCMKKFTVDKHNGGILTKQFFLVRTAYNIMNSVS